MKTSRAVIWIGLDLKDKMPGVFLSGDAPKLGTDKLSFFYGNGYITQELSVI